MMLSTPEYFKAVMAHKRAEKSFDKSTQIKHSYVSKQSEKLLTNRPKMDIADLLQRHVTGDWGDVDAEDQETNERAVQHGGQIVSSYVLSTQVKVWVISEADRSVTTLLLPEEY